MTRQAPAGESIRGPEERVGRPWSPWEDREPHDVPLAGVGLHDELEVLVRQVAPPGDLDVDLTVVVGRVIAPGEETENDSRIDPVGRGVDPEAVGAVAEAPAGDDLGADPAVLAVGDLQVLSPLGGRRRRCRRSRRRSSVRARSGRDST